jgi:hypothetical protein
MKDTGLDMPYYATPLLEVVFHEAVRMPVVKGDPKQIMKVCASSSAPSLLFPPSLPSPLPLRPSPVKNLSSILPPPSQAS